MSSSWPLLAAAVAGLLVGVVGTRMSRGRTAGVGPVVRLSVNTPSDRPLSGAPTATIALSPDGHSLVYTAQTPRGLQLYLRRLGDLEATAIPGTEGGVSPFFSPDGQWLAFFLGPSGVVKKISITGGAPLPVQGAPQVLQAASWFDNESFLITGGDGKLARLTGDGTTKPIASPDSSTGETAILPVEAMPGGQTVLAVGLNQGSVALRALIIEIASGKRKVLLEGITGVAYDDGCLIWVQPDGSLLAAPYDAGKMQFTASPTTIAQGVRVPVGGSGQFAISHSGTLAYVPELPFDLAMVDRAGRWRAAADIQRRFHSPRFSPNGRHVAVDFSQQGSRDVWLLDIQERSLSRLTFDNTGHDPVWTPDGKQVGYLHSEGGSIGIFLRNADGSGTSDSLLVAPNNLTAGPVTRDGKTMVVVGTGKNGDFDLDTMSMGPDRKLGPLVASPFNEAWPALSPDGRWLAYESDESGQPEVYVRGFRGVAGKFIVSQNGGAEPVWSRDGRELFYRGIGSQGDMLISASVQSAPDFRVLSRTALFEVGAYEAATPHANYDVSPDGKSFVMVHQGQLSQIVIVQNWQEEVRHKGRTSK